MSHYVFQRYPPWKRHACSAELCDLFIARSTETWQLLRRSWFAGVSLKEESITDLHLLAFSECKLDNFLIRAISRVEERAIGADYEMWFGDRNGGWLGIRIQAKRVDHKDHIRALNYLPNGTNESQCQALLRRCKHDRTLPAYCLYVYSNVSLEPLNGCSLISPFVVSRYKPNQSVDLTMLLWHLVPWTVLVCRPFALPYQQSLSLPQTVLRGWIHLMEMPHQGETGQSTNDTPWQEFVSDSLITDPPRYVAEMFTNRGEIDSDAALAEHNLRGVIAIREA